MIKQSQEREYFPQLTSIRAIGAYMVYLAHYNPFMKNYPAKYVGNFIYQFHLALVIFFVLSGFVITYRYMNEFEFSRKWFGKYIVNRVARVYPMYFLLTAFTFIVLYLNGGLRVSIPRVFTLFFLNITFLRGFFKNFIFTGIGQGWTLTVEECFYFAAPFIFFLSKKLNFIVQPIILLLTGCLLVLMFRNLHFFGLFESFQFMFIYTFFGRCIEFFIGIKLALIIRKRENALQLNRSGSGYTIAGIIGMLLVLLGFVLFRGETTNDADQKWYVIVLNNLVAPVFVASLFYGLITENSIFRRILKTPFLELLGRSSYAFYLIHLGVIHMLLSKVFLVKNTFTYILIFIVINILAILLHKYLETPMNLYIRKLYRQRQAPVSLSTGT